MRNCSNIARDDIAAGVERSQLMDAPQDLRVTLRRGENARTAPGSENGD